MNFFDKIQEMEYEIIKHDTECIIIEKKRNISDIIIIFDTKKRRIAGYLKPNDIISDLDDITDQYTTFREMKSDLKELAKLSNYDIIWNKIVAEKSVSIIEGKLKKEMVQNISIETQQGQIGCKTPNTYEVMLLLMHS